MRERSKARNSTQKETTATVAKIAAMSEQSKVRNWIHVPKLDKDPDAPIKSSTAYAWHHHKRFPDLFRKIGGKLFLDLGELYRRAEHGELQ